MGRYAAAALFLGTGAFVLWHNSAYSDRVLVLPGIDLVLKSTKYDLDAQGRISGYTFLVVGVLAMGWAIWKSVSTDDRTY